jgi:hypothetical protein
MFASDLQCDHLDGRQTMSRWRSRLARGAPWGENPPVRIVDNAVRVKMG